MLRRVLFIVIISLLSIDLVCFVLNFKGFIPRTEMLYINMCCISTGFILSIIGLCSPVNQSDNEIESESKVSGGSPEDPPSLVEGTPPIDLGDNNESD